MSSVNVVNEQVVSGFPAMIGMCSLAANAILIGGVKRSHLHVSMFERILRETRNLDYQPLSRHGPCSPD